MLASTRADTEWGLWVVGDQSVSKLLKIFRMGRHMATHHSAIVFS